ncbi:dihydrolipoyllysine-residue acetyltransferase component 3 of pyruvate dehydrogenase complex, mitochondrial-like [Cornus florida]|uniref:dihydrolipoyllysine-residue acetyltransferase component 3 of pyruvate dehydrogenase complex, mitochondrial-like n=1 Tax=Cornus florida TaxID=4283 RepID=UPI00289E21F8|nr:dihydrolipoyllysine-residue acetyltransferase component 3 of pyruvate dehydrogenase complex, mitochondrial-like [Cornus florida]
MTYASHIFSHSKKFRNAPSLLRQEHAILVRWFSNGVRPSINIGEDNLKFCQYDNMPGERRAFCKSSTGCTRSYRATNLAIVKIGIQNENVSRTASKMETPTAGLVFHKVFSCLQVDTVRGYSTDSGLPPHQEIGMPSLSPTMSEGNIARWLKKEGDKVSPGEVLCEVETDKATVEMECMEEGYIAKILRGDGEKEIKVGEVIVITVEDEEDIAKFKDYKPSTSGTAPPAKSPPVSAPPKEKVVEEPVSSAEPKITKDRAAPPVGDRIFASPLARKLAEDHNIPLSSVKGTGPGGHIVKADIEDYLASHGKEVSTAAHKVDAMTAASLDYKDIPHSQIRKVTASRLLLSKQTIPHYYLTVDTCVDKLMDLRSQLNLLIEASGGKRISINDLVIKAAALALRKVPQCNSSWTNDYIRQYHNVNINIAVQTDNGLFVPVIKDADKKGLSKIAEEVKNLAQKAKENSLKPEDYEGGTFTVSNLGGPFGIKQFCAIINPPQSGILAVGSAEKRAIPGLGPEQFKFASFMSVTLSCDHRVIDGAIGAEWLKAFKGYIENPESMLL